MKGFKVTYDFRGKGINHGDKGIAQWQGQELADSPTYSYRPHTGNRENRKCGETQWQTSSLKQMETKLSNTWSSGNSFSFKPPQSDSGKFLIDLYYSKTEVLWIRLLSPKSGNYNFVWFIDFEACLLAVINIELDYFVYMSGLISTYILKYFILIIFKSISPVFLKYIYIYIIFYLLSYLLWDI